MLHAAGLLQGLSSMPLLPMTSKKKKNANLATPKSPVFRESYTSERLSLLFLSFLSSFSLIQYIALCCIPSLLPPPSSCSVFSQSLCSYLLYTLTLTLFCSSAVFFPLSPASLPCPSFPVSGGVADQRGVLVPDCDNTSR